MEFTCDNCFTKFEVPGDECDVSGEWEFCTEHDDYCFCSEACLFDYLRKKSVKELRDIQKHNQWLREPIDGIIEEVDSHSDYNCAKNNGMVLILDDGTKIFEGYKQEQQLKTVPTVYVAFDEDAAGLKYPVFIVDEYYVNGYLRLLKETYPGKEIVLCK